MLMDKQAINSELESRGEKELVEQAQAKPPDQVHVGGHAVELRELGLDPDGTRSEVLWKRSAIARVTRLPVGSPS